MAENIDKRGRANVFRDRLTAAMAEAGTSRAALARGRGIDRSTITQMLSTEDVRMPGGHVVANMATGAGGIERLASGPVGPARAGQRVDRHVAFDLGGGPRQRADDQIFAWHEEAAGYKIRHVPATMPDVLKTDALMEWEYAPAKVKTPGQAIAAAHARLEWMRGTTSDYEIAIPLHEFESFVSGTGYYAGLAPDLRREQLRWFAEVYDQLFPSLRLFLYDARTVFSAPLTIFGPRLAVIYVGRHYVAFRDRGAGAGHEPPFRLARAGGDGIGQGLWRPCSNGIGIALRSSRSALKIIGKRAGTGHHPIRVTLWRPMHAVHGGNGHVVGPHRKTRTPDASPHP
jgi:lambda repressor-like predicted transcriptional regulator